jgi:hypothetical protein
MLKLTSTAAQITWSDDLDIDDLRSVSSTLAGFVMLSLGVGILWDLWCPVLLPNFNHNAPEEPANYVNKTC